MPDISGLAGSIFVCLLLAASLNGVALTQAVCYYREFWDDRWGMKLVVAVICALQSTQTCLGISWSYQCLILNAGHMNELDRINAVICARIMLATISGAIVHSCYARMLWYGDLMRKVLALLTGILGVSSCVLGLAAISYGYKMHQWTLLRNSETVSTLACLAFALAIAADILLPGLMADTLRGRRKERNGVAPNMVGASHIWTVYLSGTGMFNCIFAILSLVVFWSRRTDLLFLGFVEIRSRLYANSFLSSLNSRQHLRTETMQAQWTTWDFGPKSSIIMPPHDMGGHAIYEADGADVC
ncbi:hypothetical protein OE88DRAFT_1740008 [Heliocybe sulcata]|uniref:DUF6534 domain-containing protein n=1 Tax=Heliocybe sulcata TaxID=5364 RepID=A0A5C3MN13_9AGAM|nr:hypothetical protein OE88DRAFT_1740008 [Heliocybe sulcata]